MSNLVFIGDSLTQWCDWEQRLPGHIVTNLGIAGETVEGLLARRERIRARILDPDFIFLMTGINNIATGERDIIKPYREIVRNLTTWYKKARTVVQSVLPADLEWIDNNDIRDINRLLEQIAREYGADYLDIYSRFVDPQGNPQHGYLSDDGVHLAGMGYDVWSKEVARFVNDQRKIS
jgi:lysophospholipase L1-like esterase